MADQVLVLECVLDLLGVLPILPAGQEQVERKGQPLAQRFREPDHVGGCLPGVHLPRIAHHHGVPGNPQLGAGGAAFDGRGGGSLGTGVERVDDRAGGRPQVVAHGSREVVGAEPAVHEPPDAAVLAQVALVVLVEGDHGGKVRPQAVQPGQGALHALVVADHQQIRAVPPQPAEGTPGARKVDHFSHVGIPLPQLGFDVALVGFLPEQHRDPHGQVRQGGDLFEKDPLATPEGQLPVGKDNVLHGTPEMTSS